MLNRRDVSQNSYHNNEVRFLSMYDVEVIAARNASVVRSFSRNIVIT